MFVYQANNKLLEKWKMYVLSPVRRKEKEQERKKNKELAPLSRLINVT